MKISGIGWNSLAGRMMIAFSAFVVLVTALFIAVPYGITRVALEQAAVDRGRLELRSFQREVSGAYRTGGVPAVQNLFRRTREEGHDVAWAAFADGSGTFVAHTTPSRAGQRWDGAGKGTPEGRRPSSEPGASMELSSPVVDGGKTLGVLVIGISDAGVSAILDRLLSRLLLVGLAVIVVSMVSTFPFTRRMFSGLTRLKDITREISRGELRTQVPEEGYDEVRAVARDFNRMAGTLRTVIRQIQEAGGAIGEHSSGITDVIQAQATSASQQAASLAEVTATMEELSRTSHQISGNAEAVKSSAEQTVEMAQQGKVLVEESVDGMGKIKERVTDIAQKTLFLGEKSHEIGKVMDLIKEIAGEIHLLALNAAIESAAAGEHGRRFAVVASEVRRLAEKTRESTEAIRSLVSEIQSATQGSIRATEQGNLEVDKWRETINLTAGAFEEIIGMIEKTSEASMQISLATHQQTSANDQVVAGMRQVAEMVRLTASHMKESSASATELKGMAAMLTEKTSVFRV
ncbi:MAG TPA: methyl-accepting chemotaxis protein [Candidatus Deferrimicrobiaceae bacterium]